MEHVEEDKDASSDSNISFLDKLIIEQANYYETTPERWSAILNWWIDNDQGEEFDQ